MAFLKSTLNLLLFLLGLLGISQESLGLQPHYTIQGTFKLPNSIDYTIKVSNLPEKFQSRFQLNPGLKLSLLNNDLLIPLNNNEFSYIDNGDQVFEAHISGQLQNTIGDDPLYSDDELILTGSSNWIPFLFPTQTLNLTIHSSPGIKVFNPSEKSRGCGPDCIEFEENRPQEDIYLVIGKFHEYTHKEANGLTAGVLLINDDPALAQSYLDLLPGYIQRYSQLIGEYPYKSFYVIENFNETGLGMPGFTLLGASVIRLPFILKSSLPHEVLHNWWGNGVFVDYQKGNWCEGLTTYLADHYEQSLINLDSNYRRNSLVTYLDYVTHENEFPLIDFQGRHNESSQAIGYGKSMMFFHMLKNWIGEDNFNKGLQQSYIENQFKNVGFLEFLKPFQTNYTETLESFIKPWVLENGAATIKAQAICQNQQWILQIESTPSQFQYMLPYKLEASNQKRELLKIKNGIEKINLPKGFKGKVTLDPDFEVFRTLSSGEKPLTFSRVLSAKTLYAVVEAPLKNNFSQWIEGLKTQFQGEINFININEIETLPNNSQVIFYGFSPPERIDFQQRATELGILFNDDQLNYKSLSYDTSTHSWIVMTESALNGINYSWVKPNLKIDQAQWGRQLTHYSQQGLLVYWDKKNVVKESLSAGKSNLESTLGDCIK